MHRCPNVDGLVTVINPTTLVVSSFTPTPTGFVAVFDKPIATAQLNLYNAEFGGLGAPDLTVVSPSGADVQGSLLVDPTDTTITFIKTGNGVSRAADRRHSIRSRSAAPAMPSPTPAAICWTAWATAFRAAISPTFSA